MHGKERMNVKYVSRMGVLAACLAAGLLCTPVLTMARTIDITTPVAPPKKVFGNSSGGNTDPSLCDETPVNNTVNVNATTGSHVYGSQYVNAGDDVTGNTVNIGAGAGISGSVYGGYSDLGMAGRNTINISAGNVTGTLYGGYGSGYVYGNTVNLSGGNIGAHIYGGYNSNNGNVTGNIVNISDGNFSKNIFGGSAASGNATMNYINISGGTLSGKIYGGYSSSGEATTNKITITGAPNLNSAQLYGGIGTVVRHNSLNMKTSGISVKDLKNFTDLNFYVPGDLVANGTMLTVTGTADIEGATVRVGMNGNNSPLEVGDSIKLLDATTGTLNHGNNLFVGDANALAVTGITKVYAFDIAIDGTGKIIEAKVSDIIEQTDDDNGNGDNGNNGEIAGRFRAQLKSLTEARVSGVGMLTQGADMLATQGIPQLRASAQQGSGPAMFGVMGGQSLRYNSGSHVDVDGFNLATGLGWNFPLGTEGNKGNLLVGAFFESGWGSYDSHNSFGNAASVKGDGDTNYYGGGILARYDSPLIGPGNLYTEASFRAGKVETDYSSSDFLNSSFTGKVDYDSSAAYYGAHAGIGYLWNITENSTLDTYTKYLWTRQGSDSVTIEGDSIRFKETDSHRWRTGAKFSHALATDSGMLFTPYLGAAYEHEFDSKARATANGNAIDAPDVKGGTGIGELGFSFKPSAASGFSVDLGMQGYTGKREGVGGSLQLKFEF